MHVLILRLCKLMILSTSIMVPLVTYAVPPVCNDSLVVTKTQDLSFGDHISGTGGVITVDSTGVRTASGGVVLAGGTVTPGVYQFSNPVVQCKGKPIYMLVVSGDITLNSPAPGTMTVTNFTTNFGPAPAQLKLSDIVSVGAELVTGSGQASGTYNGTYDFTFEQGK